jgi:hypothetical protein
VLVLQMADGKIEVVQMKITAESQQADQVYLRLVRVVVLQTGIAEAGALAQEKVYILRANKQEPAQI